MAFPQVVTTATTNSGSNTTSHVINFPASIAAGNRILCLFSVDAAPTVSWPAGWTQLNDSTGTPKGQHTHSTPVNVLDARYYDVVGGEGATFTITTDDSQRSTARTWRITGHHSDAPQWATTDDGTANLDPPSLSPSWGSADNLWFVAVSHDNNNLRTVTAAPTNYDTNFVYDGDASTDAAPLGSSYRESAASSENPGTFSMSDVEQDITATIAVRPTSAGQPFRSRLGAVPLAGNNSAFITFGFRP